MGEGAMSSLHECSCNPDKLCVWRPSCKEGALLEAAAFALAVFRTRSHSIADAVAVGRLHNEAEQRLQEALDKYGQAEVGPLVLHARETT